MSQVTCIYLCNVSLDEKEELKFSSQLKLQQFICSFMRCIKWAGWSTLHYFRLCNTLWFWWLSIPIWTSNIIKQAKRNIHQTRLAQCSKERSAGQRNTNKTFKKGHRPKNLNRNVEDKHATLKKHNFIYYVASFLCGSRRLNRDCSCALCGSLWICVRLWS